MWSYSSGWVSSGTSFPTHWWKKDLQDIHFSLSPTSSGRLTHHPKPTRIKETDHVSNGHRPNLQNKTLVIFASKETKAVLDGTMYPQQRCSKRKKKRMHGAKHLCYLTLLLPSAKSRNHVHATQHYTLDNTTTTLIYLFKFKSKQLRRQKGWHYCICACMKVCVCVHVCESERVVPQRLVVCQLYISLKQFHFLSLRYGFMCFSFHFCKWHQQNVRPSDCLATPSTFLAVM